MRTTDAIAMFGCGRGAKTKLAKALGITLPSICGWGDTVPALRAYQLREKFPDLFPTPTKADTEQQTVA